jgi:hypothetical protein
MLPCASAVRALSRKLRAFDGKESTPHAALSFRCSNEDTRIADANAAKPSVKARVLVGVIEHQPARSGGSLADQFAIVRAPLCLTHHVPSGECRTVKLSIGDETWSLEHGRSSWGTAIIRCCRYSLRKKSSSRESANRQQAQHKCFARIIDHF